MDTVAEYAAKMDTTGQFLGQRCEVTGDLKDKVRRSTLWTEYLGWCAVNALKTTVTQAQWTEDVEKHGVRFHPKTGGHPVFTRIRLLTPAEMLVRESAGE